MRTQTNVPDQRAAISTESGLRSAEASSPATPLLQLVSFSKGLRSSKGVTPAKLFQISARVLNRLSEVRLASSFRETHSSQHDSW